MGMHDRIAAMAIQQGNTSAVFHAAAQRHAYGTWLFLILAVVVWYLASGAWALLPLGLAVLSAFRSISSTMVAIRLERMEATT